MNEHNRTRRVSMWLLTACGIWLVSLGLFFIFLRPALLPEDTTYMGSTFEQVRNAVPGLEGWLKRVFIVMGGFMTGTGVLTIFTARAVMPMGSRGASWAIALAGLLTVGLMASINFDLHSDFRWLLMLPVVVWIASIVFYALKR